MKLQDVLFQDEFNQREYFNRCIISLSICYTFYPVKRKPEIHMETCPPQGKGQGLIASMKNDYSAYV